MAGGLTKKAEPPPTCDVNRDSGTASANGGWLRRLVRPHGQPSFPIYQPHIHNRSITNRPIKTGEGSWETELLAEVRRILDNVAWNVKARDRIVDNASVAVKHPIVSNHHLAMISNHSDDTLTAKPTWLAAEQM